MSPKKDAPKSARSARVTGKAFKGFTDEERAAMKERVQELKAEARRGPRAMKADGERDVLAKIAEMPERDRAMAGGSMPSSRPARRPSRREPGTGCRTAPALSPSAQQRHRPFQPRIPPRLEIGLRERRHRHGRRDAGSVEAGALLREKQLVRQPHAPAVR